MLTTVPVSAFEARIETVRDELAETHTDALCLFSATAIEWVSGYHHLQTERPVCLAVTDEAVEITVPRLEADRARSDSFPLLEDIHVYYDYPGDDDGAYPVHEGHTPESAIAGMLDGLGVETVAADSNGPPGFWGYSGPSLDEFADVAVETVEWITEWRKQKSETEFELMAHSAMWGNLAHRKLAEYAAPGNHELAVAKRASLDASMAMLDSLGQRYDSHLRGGFPASCGFLSGKNTARPHGLTQNRRLEAGDVLITGASANVGGYVSELERTMFLGEPTDTQRERFEIAREAQSIAFEACEPGVPCAQVDRAVHEYFEEQGVLEYAQHHTGHNLGLEGHEREFIDRGSDEVMQPGHAYSIEPGIYFPDDAGYRHSDTVLIGEDGIERITFFPRDVESNTIR